MMLGTLRHFVSWALGFKKPETQTTDAERNCLERHAKGRRRLAEIGVWHGVTTQILRRVMDPEGMLFAIDPFPVGRLYFSTHRVIAQWGVNRVKNGFVHWLRATGAAAARDPLVLADPIDFLFIDGDHSYEGIRADWEAWSGLIGSGGVVGLHDSQPTATRPIHDAGSVHYTADVISKDLRFEVVDLVDSLTVLRRKDGIH